jgi:soluble lytic murein transglycosylase-like protein
MPIALLSTLLCASHSTGAAPLLVEELGANPPSMDELFRKWGAVYGVEWQLLKAVARKESRLNPNAVNNADNESIGLMQVLCRPDGQEGCANGLKVDGWSEATRGKLFDPEFNIRIGAQILAWNIRKYGLPKAIAVYNRWSERSSPVAGPFENQAYVAAVLGNYRYKVSAFGTQSLLNGPAWYLGSLALPGVNSCSSASVL